MHFAPVPRVLAPILIRAEDLEPAAVELFNELQRRGFQVSASSDHNGDPQLDIATIAGVRQGSHYNDLRPQIDAKFRAIWDVARYAATTK